MVDACSEEGAMVHELVRAVQGAAEEGAQGEEVRGLQQAKDLPGPERGHPRRTPLVAHPTIARPGQDGAALLLLGVLGLLPPLQRRVHLPPRAAHPDQRAVLRHVPPLLLLPGSHRRRPPHGARPPHRLRPHHILDGRPQAASRCVRPLPSGRPLQRPRLPEPRPGHGGAPHECQAGHHPGLRHHLGLPHRRRVLRPTDTPLHRLAQVLELQLLLLQAPPRRPVQREGLLRVLARAHVPGGGVPCDQVGGAEPHVGGRVHHGAHARGVPARRLPGAAPPAAQVRKRKSPCQPWMLSNCLPRRLDPREKYR